jgi:hypothetical protein
MASPWMFGLEAVQLGWQAQIALAFKVMRSFAAGVPDQFRLGPVSPGTVADDAEAQEKIAPMPAAPAAIIDKQESPSAIAADRRSKAPKVLSAPKKSSTKASRGKAPLVPKRTAATQNSARKAIRRSARKRGR